LALTALGNIAGPFMPPPACRSAGSTQGGGQISGDRRKADLGQSERRSTISGAAGLMVSVYAASAPIGSASLKIVRYLSPIEPASTAVVHDINVCLRR
jgi:hypothetical protein